MSVPYTSTFTVWPAASPNDRGDVVYAPPTVFRGLFKHGGNIKLTDKSGQEFYPKSTYWSSLQVFSGNPYTPRNGDLIALGTHGDINPSDIDTQQIRGQTVFDNSMFGKPVDYIFGTM